MRAAVVCALLAAARACATDFDCSLNGVCSGGACACDAPWSGAACGTMTYAVTPAASQNLWTGPSSLNTWNGPLIFSPDSTFHLFVPVYAHASLWTVLYYAHGVAGAVEGPYDFSSPNISSTSINPSSLVFPNSSTGSPVYSLWIGDEIFVAAAAAGPYVAAAKNPAPSNSAPAYHAGAFYLTDQSTTSLLTATSLAGPWTTFATITHPTLPYTVEDPFLYVDKRGNFHIINHAYSTAQKTNCSSSYVSSHFFAAADGKQWGHSDQPYGHTVQFDDGTQHSYCTLERPNLFFDADGVLTHVHFAADLVTGDEGCAARGKGCVDCKYLDHAGTLLVKLATQ